MNQFTSIWTKELKEELKTLWGRMSATEIAAMFNTKYGFKLTRNSIIGVVHRLRIKDGYIPRKLPGRKPKPDQPILRRRPVHEPEVPQVLTLKLPPAPPPFKPTWTCQYFIGDQKCGQPSQGSWCEEHKKIVYAPKPQLYNTKPPQYGAHRNNRS